MAEIKAIITGQNNISPAVKSAEKDLTGFQNTVKKTGDAMNKAFVATAVVAGIMKIASAAKECINEFSEAEKVSLRLEKVWNNVGNATGKSYDSIEKYAESIEKTTYFSAEAVKESALLLAATESLTKKGFDRALDASADLAAALGEDMTAAASTLAKAMEDPASALTRLKTIGVTFTEEEKNQIKALTEANKTYEAQEIILTKIESKYKDVAKAINSTPSGKLDNIKDVLSDIRKSLGGALLDSISPALDALYDSLVQIYTLINTMTGSGSKIVDEINTARKNGETVNYSQYTTADLLSAIETLENRIDFDAQVEQGKGVVGWFSKMIRGDNASLATYGKLTDFTTINAISSELKRRGFLSIEDARRGYTNGGAAYTWGEDDSTETNTEPLEKAFQAFLNKYGSSSSYYLKTSYESIIASAQALRDQMTFEKDGTLFFNKNTRLDWGVESLDEFSDIYKQLGEIITTYGKKIEDLTPQETIEPTELEKILDSYGKNSASYEAKNLSAAIEKIKAVRNDADAENQTYLDEILSKLEEQLTELQKQPEKEKEANKTFIEKLTNSFGKMLEGTWQTRGLVNFDTVIDEEQAAAAASTLVNTAISNIGEAGDVIQRLATNMAAMGPVLGAIVTALQYVIEGFAEVLRDTLNTFVRYGIEPLREFGRILADAILPLFEAIMPSVADTAEILVEIFTLLGKVLKPIITAIGNVLGPILSTITQIIERLMPVIQAVANVFIGLAAVIEWFGQWIGHIIAWVVNNALGWAGVHINDPGRPDDLATFIDDRMANVGEFNSAFSGEAATQTAVQNASYSGGTTVHLNVYNYGNIVGENGINEFALTIRDKLYEMNYYGR